MLKFSFNPSCLLPTCGGQTVLSSTEYEKLSLTELILRCQCKINYFFLYFFFFSTGHFYLFNSLFKLEKKFGRCFGFPYRIWIPKHNLSLQSGCLCGSWGTGVWGKSIQVWLPTSLTLAENVFKKQTSPQGASAAAFLLHTGWKP